MTDLAEQRRQAAAMNKAAAEQWVAAVRAHVMAPPDPGFVGRLRALAEAARSRARAARVADAAGLKWVARQSAVYNKPPYELRPGTGRPGSGELWGRFDGAVEAYNKALTGTSARTVGDAADALAQAAEAIADDVERERREASGTAAER